MQCRCVKGVGVHYCKLRNYLCDLIDQSNLIGRPFILQKLSILLRIVLLFILKVYVKAVYKIREDLFENW